MKKLLGASVALVALAAATPAFAKPKTASGTAGGLTWEAANTIVGQNGTGTSAATPPGNPIYLAPRPKYNNVVQLRMDYAGGSFVCSGTLLSDRMSIATAAHCVSDGAGTENPILTRAYFSNSNDDLLRPIDNPPGTVVRTVSRYIVNDEYTGQVIDQNDIAILRLNAGAPSWANATEIYTLGDLTGKDFNVAGYGTRSTTGGNDGTTGPGAGAGIGRLRQGDNRYDFAFGDSDWGGFWTDTPNPNRPGSTNWFGTAEIEFSFLSDFDNGLAAQDASCRLALDFDIAASAKYCNLGRGATEVSIAGGDSGGPGFIDGKLASINSYGLSFGSFYGDIKPGLQSSFGEFNGFVPTYIHEDFIAAAQGVPEPASWAMMIGGFGAIGGMVRRRRSSMRVTYA